MKTALAQLLKPSLAKLISAAVVILSLAWPAHVWASVYGCGSYNDNTYNNSCAAAGSSTSSTPATTDQTQTPVESPNNGPIPATETPSTSQTPSSATKHNSFWDLIFKKYKWITMAVFGLMALAGIFWFILLAKRRRHHDAMWNTPTGTV